VWVLIEVIVLGVCHSVCLLNMLLGPLKHSQL